MRRIAIRAAKAADRRDSLSSPQLDGWDCIGTGSARILPVGLFSRKPRTRKPDVVVLCLFRELTHANPLRTFDPESAYAYRWGLPTPPRVGQWATVDGYDGPATVIVGAIGPNSYVKQSGAVSLAVITRLVPDAKVARAQASLAKKAATANAEEAAWLSHCRWVAGVDASEPASPVPAGYEIPPLPDDSASVELADRHGDSWWRVAKEAEKVGQSEADVDQLKDVARSWYRIRDAAVKAEQIAAVKSAATDEQLD